MAAVEQQAAPTVLDRDFDLFAQSLDLDVDFNSQSLIGTTTMQILPTSKDLRQIPLNCRQCTIQSVEVEGRLAPFAYRDPFERLNIRPSYGVRQHHFVRNALEPLLQGDAAPDLLITIPKGVKIQQLSCDSDIAQQQIANKSSKRNGDVSAVPDTPVLSNIADEATTFAPLAIRITFRVQNIREGLQFVGLSGGDARYPHVFTRNKSHAGAACCLFPCVDDIHVRCQWDINIKSPKTLGDALKRATVVPSKIATGLDVNQQPRQAPWSSAEPFNHGLSEEELTLDMVVVCSGAITDEITDPHDPTCKIVSFSCESTLSANQLGFAIGPFETIELSDYRELDEDDKLGANAAPVHAFCLPGRADEVRNTAMPMAKAIDFFTTNFTTYPFSSYKMCFLEDLESDTVITASLSLCSTRLLFPEDIIDPIRDVTRKLVHALASQYSGISFVPSEPEDTWVVYGIAYYMTDLFLRTLMGNNEYRFQQKLDADRIFELDIRRPSLHNLGLSMHVDQSNEDLMALKAGTVLFILDRRLTKLSGSAGVARIISRIVTNAKSEDSSAFVTTAEFKRTSEKLGHMKLDSFFNHWVYGAGCPHFVVTQRFNKKKLVVEMSIDQVQRDETSQQRGLDLKADNFLRDFNEDAEGLVADKLQPAFSGPMTIRIHEADGTPYEHIVDIKDVHTKLEIPYNTKYKRLKRSRRQKDRIAIPGVADNAADVQDDVLVYCLGDVLQSPEEVTEWRLRDWPQEVEDLMSQESYEWIRMDADFEWICKMQIEMPPYMFVSQLQQDRDVVAQYESLQWLVAQNPNWIIPTFLTRTIMDQRYFHGVRTKAVQGLPRSAKWELDWLGQFHLEKIFQEMFCVGKSPMTRSNDFSDRAAYLLQCAIPRAMAQIRTGAGVAPHDVKQFFVDKLKFNDNTSNDFSDCYYVTTLMSCMTDTMVASYGSNRVQSFDEEGEVQAIAFNRDAMSEIERHRRIDEWIPSYRNMHSATAIDCLRRLAKADIIKPRLADFAQYTKAGSADDLRLAGLRCLVELDLLKSDAVLNFILHSLSSDLSPYMRSNIYKLFGYGLGLVAIGIRQDAPPAEPVDTGLVIEQDVATEKQADVIARKTDITKAIEGLKQDIGSRKTLANALWRAVKSPLLSPLEMLRLVDICALFYDPYNALEIRLRLPRYWRCENLGDGKVKFAETPKVREKPRTVRSTKPITQNAPNMLKLPKQPSAPAPPSRTISLSRPINGTPVPAPLKIPISNGVSAASSPPATSTQKLSLKSSAAPKPLPTPKQAPKNRITSTPETPAISKPSPKPHASAEPKRLIIKLNIGAHNLPATSPSSNPPNRAPTPIKSEPDSALSPSATFGTTNLMSPPPPRPNSAASGASKRPTSSKSSAAGGRKSKSGTPQPAPPSRKASISKPRAKSKSKSQSSTPQPAAKRRKSSVSNGLPAGDANGLPVPPPPKGKKRKSETPVEEPTAPPPPAKKQATGGLKLKLNLGAKPAGAQQGSPGA
ncbi:MAG: hypothetical protein M1828_001088 [Chrysothrix sp. TS-e1954]|nr:MAG: hypothetical protein M1828_001088 [Chrysothrix sp. TS-e1954]